ncbi:MAG: SDR family oxidoreductase [Rhodanobacteraceae bacterium]|nr:SDR family oxidoreductase [Rhodanobacteraceae bacterium]MBP9154425.1 SDR family oxidoreductase [Xanthomonadales bacterium]HQW81538.1 SDR family oxidoreductase [Pseudomonadota bacterium]
MSRPRALITGAGSGLGRALAHRYARAGYDIAVAELLTERAKTVVDELAAHGGSHFAVEVDVGDDASVEAMRDTVRAHWDGFDVLINNAGVASAGSIADSSLDDWRWVTNIDLFGVVRGMKAFAPMFQTQRRGHVLSTASFAGIAGAPGIASYGVAKAGVVALSEALRGEMALFDVKVSVICPIFFKTNLLETARSPNAKFIGVAAKLMDNAKESADDIADYVFKAQQRGDFMIIPTTTERIRWRVKRWFPELYFRELMKLARKTMARSG